jgi:predicted DCC family thiol-disulfide oxidoreductase YuxK
MLPAPPTSKSNTTNIVFFDGVCNFCNKIVNVLLDLDTHKRLVFAPLQGETYRQYSTARGEKTSDFSTIVFVQHGREYTKSDAAIRVIACLGGGYRISLGLLLFPRFLRNAAYNLIARNRYSWFGKREACRLPTLDERMRFLP